MNMRRELRTSLSSLGAALVVLTCATAGRADLFYSGASGNLAASVNFAISGNQVNVTLTNTSTADVLVPADVLTAVFFNNGPLTFSSVSALLNTGSTVSYDSDGQPAGGVVGGEWTYESGLSVDGFTAGISSSGLGGTFGNSTSFPGPNLAGPTAPDGLQYGILSAGDDSGTGNGGITGSGGLIKNSVLFTLGYTGDQLTDETLGAILGGTVRFQYGTALNEPNFLHSPEPSSLAIAGLGALGFVGYGLRRRRSAE